jgi:predicted DCC family thiol-disulfide oxidoreductase YuxK
MLPSVGPYAGGVRSDGRTTVLYDGGCGFCRWSAERLRAWDRRGRLRFVPIQGAEGDELLVGVPAGARLASMHVVDRLGMVRSGGASLPAVLRELPGGRPVAWVAEQAPGPTDRVYRTIARHRGRLSRALGRRACAVDPGRDDAAHDRHGPVPGRPITR